MRAEKSAETSLAQPAARSLAATLRSVLVLSALAGALVFLACSLIAPRFTAEARLALSGKNAISGALEPLTSEALQRQVRAIAAPEIAGEIARQLKLSEKVEFNRSLGFPDAWTRLLALAGIGAAAPNEKDPVRSAVLRQFDVSALPEPGHVTIRFRATDPELAAAGANEIAAAYIKSLQAGAWSGAEAQAQAPTAQPSSSPTGSPELSARIEKAAAAVKDLNARITAASAEIAAFETEKNRLANEAAQSKPKPAQASEPRVTEITAELARAKAQRVEADAQVKAAKESTKSGNVDALIDLQKSPTVQTLLQDRARLERQITELSASLLPEHPRMQQLNAKLAGMKRDIAVIVGKSVEKLERDAKTAAAREEALRKSLDEIVAQPSAQPPQNDGKLRQIETGLKERRAELERLKAELGEAEQNRIAAPIPTAPAGNAGAPKAQAAATLVEAQLVSPAVGTGLMPVPDKKKLSILAALAAAGAGLMLGLMKSLVGRRLGRKASAVAVGAKPDAALGEDAEHDVETFVEAHAAAQQAQVKGSPKPAAAVGHRVPFAPPEPRAASHGEVAALDIEANCDAIRLDEIAREILSRPPQEIGIRTLVTGVDIAIQPAGEALGLARRLTAGGKSVVLVDWSTEGHGLAELLAVKSEPGINEVLIGRASFEDVVQCLLEVGGNELHVIAAGADLTGKADALDPDVINLVLDALDEAYDHIVVVGRHDEARELFESILGRFDVGVLIGEAGARANVQPGTFLGFDVTEIVTFDCTRPSPVPASIPKAAKAAAGKAAAVADGPAPVSQAAIARALRSSAQRAAAGGNRA